MNSQTMSLPINIPWKLVAASQDMMDTIPNSLSPFPWRSSLAIYAYEPKPDEIDPALCDETITFVKITSSITGLQLSEEETKLISNTRDVPTVEYPGKQAEDAVENILEDYLACFGVLLTVTVFPQIPRRSSVAIEPVKEVPLDDLPHIIDFEPKKRDLYQAATESGEILTASRAAVTTGKSFTTTDSSETGLSLGATVPLGDSGAMGSAGLTQQWGHTEQDNQTFNTDSSREKRETTGTVTNLTQMYNLLMGYHAGTNRVTFFMQPRPHTLQPTDRRTFVQGVREIEGQQDFFLVVSRPSRIKGLCIKTRLETGHFGEATPNQEVEGSFERKEEKIVIDEFVRAGFGEEKKKTIAFESALLERDGWEFDPDEGDGGHGSVHESLHDDDDANNGENMEGTRTYKTDSGKLFVNATIVAHGPWGIGKVIVSFHRTYTVYLRKRTGTGPTEQANPLHLIIAQRRLGACFTTDDHGCIVVRSSAEIDLDDYFDDVADHGMIDENVVVDEQDFPWDDLLPDGKGFDGKRFYKRLQSKMTGSWRLPSRRAPGTFSLIDTDYFKDRFTVALPPSRLQQTVVQVEGVPRQVAEKLDRNMKVGDLLKLSLPNLARKTQLSLIEAINLRRVVMGMPEKAERSQRQSRRPKDRADADHDPS